MRRLILAALLMGCGDRTTDRDRTPKIRVDIGTGVDEYVPLEDGDTLTMTHGPQGAWHFDLAAFVSNVPDFVGVTNTLRVVATDDPLIAAAPQYIALVDYSEEDAAGYLWGVRAIMGDLPHIDQAYICALHNDAVEVCSEITHPEIDSFGTGCVTVIVAADPLDIERFCRYAPRI